MLKTLLVCAALLLTACDNNSGYAGEGSEGPCETGDAQCVDQRTIQYCDDGAWEEPAECPPEETNLGPVRTYCFEAGFCGPG